MDLKFQLLYLLVFGSGGILSLFWRRNQPQTQWGWEFFTLAQGNHTWSQQRSTSTRPFAESLEWAV